MKLPLLLYAALLFGINIIAMEPAESQEKNDITLQSLFTAIKNYRYDISADLIKKQPELVNSYGEYRGHSWIFTELTPVHLASFLGNSVALDQLLTVSNQSVNSPTSFDYTPLHLAMDKRVVKVLLSHGASLDPKVTRRNSLLHTKLFHNHLESLDAAACLIKKGTDINQKNECGESLLYEACYQGCSESIAQLLLESGADLDGIETRFNFAQHYSRKAKVFQKAGLVCYWFQVGMMDFFEEFIKDPEHFFTNPMYKKRDDSFDNFLPLYCMANQQEMGNDAALGDGHSPRIQVKTSTCFTTYIFKRASFADLQDYFGKTAIDCLKNYFRPLFEKAQQLIIDHNPTCAEYLNKCDINSLDKKGRSLLYRAFVNNNGETIKCLLKKDINDKIIQDVFATVARGHNEASIWKFCVPLINNFFSKRLTRKMDNFVVKNILCWKRMALSDRMEYFFNVLTIRPDKAPSFFKRKIAVNYRNEQGMFPLTHLVQFLLQKKWPWDSISSDHKHAVCLLLSRGAVVEKSLLNEDYEKIPELKELLMSVTG